MAIQVTGTTIIDDYKRITNIGGKGGIISGTFTIGGPQGFGYVRCNGFRGHAIGFVSFDNADSGDNFGSMSAALGWSIKTGSDFIKNYSIHQTGNNINFIAIDQNQQFQFNVYNYYTTRTVYYSFWYCGSTVPTITIAN